MVLWLMLNKEGYMKIFSFVLKGICKMILIGIFGLPILVISAFEIIGRDFEKSEFIELFDKLIKW